MQSLGGFNEMTAWQIALSDLVRPLSSIRRLATNYMKALGAGLLLAIGTLLFVPVSAKADCGVTDTGIPEGAAFNLDVGGARQALAKSGIQLSGYYYGESFGNW